MQWNLRKYVLVFIKDKKGRLVPDSLLMQGFGDVSGLILASNEVVSMTWNRGHLGQ